MRLRNINIITCDCGAELNPEITAPQDYIKYADGTATCSRCGASGVIEFPKVAEVTVEPSVPLEEVVSDLVQALVDKGVLY